VCTELFRLLYNLYYQKDFNMSVIKKQENILAG